MGSGSDKEEKKIKRLKKGGSKMVKSSITTKKNEIMSNNWSSYP